jgi:hypothetical protein
LTRHRAAPIKTMEVAKGRTVSFAVTGPDYGQSAPGAGENAAGFDHGKD